MKPIQNVFIWMLIACCLPIGGFAQYSMQEMGVSVGAGVGLFPNTQKVALGPAVSAEYFFSHYACGKAYGLHFTGGVNAAFPMDGNSGEWIDQLGTKSSLQVIGVDFGAYGKIRLHEYHRPKEWAVFLGPKIMVPLVAKYSTDLGSGSLSSTSLSVNRILPGIHLSMQFRRAIKKQSWFLEPGVEYYFNPLFQSWGGGNVTQAQVFLKFSYAFWDQRG